MIIGVHGILTDGRDSTDKLLGAVKARRPERIVHEFDWMPSGPLIAAALRGHYAKRLRKRCKTRPVHIVAHSFGCSIVLEAMRQGAKFEQVFLFNPAIPGNVEFPAEGYEHIYVIANTKDRALLVGDALLEWAGYGDMGVTGYMGRSSRVTSIHGPRPAFKAFPEHGEAFNDGNLQEWATFIDLRIYNWETT